MAVAARRFIMTLMCADDQSQQRAVAGAKIEGQRNQGPGLRTMFV